MRAFGELLAWHRTAQEATETFGRDGRASPRRRAAAVPPADAPPPAGDVPASAPLEHHAPMQ
eukprot:1794941-Alexandrium_andersonii.AAC.1